jgi:hypothetical protein
MVHFWTGQHCTQYANNLWAGTAQSV